MYSTKIIVGWSSLIFIYIIYLALNTYIVYTIDPARDEVYPILNGDKGFYAWMIIKHVLLPQTSCL